MKLQNIVPWGRNLDEYRAMFLLSEEDLGKKILGCGDGPASFNSEVHARGGSVVSVDPIYIFSKVQIAARIDAVADEVMAQVRKKHNDFLWESIPSIEDLYMLRMHAMEMFLKDFEQGKEEGRYVAASLPELPFEEDSFDLALSSHFLFLYSAHLNGAFHELAILEMLRVTEEVRIFPLVGLDGKISQHLKPVMQKLQNNGYHAMVRKCDYHFQKGADEVLVVKRKSDIT